MQPEEAPAKPETVKKPDEAQAPKAKEVAQPSLAVKKDAVDNPEDFAPIIPKAAEPTAANYALAALGAIVVVGIIFLLVWKVL